MTNATKPLHTLNARGNIFLEVTRDYFKLTPQQMFRQIQALRNAAEEALALKGISYDALKTALVPDRQRREIALVFDSTAINSNWYGLEVFKKTMPLFDKRSNHSVMAGDYIGNRDQQAAMHIAMSEAVKLRRSAEFRYSEQFYIIYINNLTPSMIEKFDEGLAEYEPYIGYADTTYTSVFKFYLSTMLVNLFIKHGKIILQGHEDDLPNNEDLNTCGYPFEDYGYECRSIQEYLKGTLLSYKIERPVFEGFEVDTEFSLNAVNPLPLPLNDFSILVEDAKLEYLKDAKAGSIERAGLEQVSAAELADLIASKISASYIYNMSFDATHNTTKFNVIIELPSQSSVEPTRLLAALQYQPDENRLRLITLY